MSRNISAPTTLFLKLRNNLFKVNCATASFHVKIVNLPQNVLVVEEV